MECRFEKAVEILNDSQINNFLGSFASYGAAAAKIKKDYNVENNINFNIFSSFSDFYYRENFHSDIIKLILDPNTEKIGNRKNIELFVDLLKKIKPVIKININNDITVEREKGRIDVLVYDNDMNGIIIENKINNAVDREDQLGCYYLKAQKRKIKVESVVYLTPTPEKKLNINYSIENPYLRNKIKKILIEVPVVNTTDKPSFAVDFIDECQKNAKTNIARVFFSEYSELIKFSGRCCMSRELEKQAIKDIYLSKSKDKVCVFDFIGDMYSRKDVLLWEIFKDYLVVECNFKIHDAEPATTVYKNIIDDKNIGFCTDFSLGFVYRSRGDKNFSSETKQKFRSILDGFQLLKHYSYGEQADDKTEGWVYITIDSHKITELDDIKKLMVDFEKIVRDYYST
jgi:hypothetical protein